LPQFTGLEALFQQKPDLVLVQGDTTTALQQLWQRFLQKILWGHGSWITN